MPPGDVHVASHHYSPKAKDFAFDRESLREKDIEQGGGGELSDRNRSYTHYTQESRWKTFTRSVSQARETTHQQNKIVDADWLNQNFGDYSDPWQGYIDEKGDESARQSATFIQRRKIWMKGFQYRILHSPIVPLIIRLTVFIFSAIALSLGGSIRQLSTTHSRPQGPSPLMAIIFDAIALVYLVYITYDEYTGKPLGLRSASAKIRLIFLDLVFIVFASANLSLAFASLSDVNGSCSSGDIDLTINPRNDKICDRQKVLAAVLLVVLVAWLMTFMISALRYVIPRTPLLLSLPFLTSLFQGHRASRSQVGPFYSLSLIHHYYYTIISLCHCYPASLHCILPHVFLQPLYITLSLHYYTTPLFLPAFFASIAGIYICFVLLIIIIACFILIQRVGKAVLLDPVSNNYSPPSPFFLSSHLAFGFSVFPFFGCIHQFCFS